MTSRWIFLYVILIAIESFSSAEAHQPRIISEVRQPQARTTLRFFLTQVPHDLTPHLEFITIDDFSALQRLSEECPVVDGVGRVGCGVNVFREEALRETERPFPPDSRYAEVSVDLFYGAVSHEWTHQISQYMGHRWHHEPGPAIDSPNYPFDRGYSEFQQQLVDEAGCDARHYLRSMIPDCYFVNAPQEFLASIGNQWFACSECVFGLALDQWEQGNRHPLNQLILATISWSSFGGTSYLQTRMQAGIVHAYRYLSPGEAQHRLWSVQPWACGEQVTISSDTFTATLELNASCRVVRVVHRENL